MYHDAAVILSTPELQLPDVPTARKLHYAALDELRRREYKVRKARYAYRVNPTPEKKAALELECKRLDDAADDEWAALTLLNKAQAAYQEAKARR